MRGGAVAPSSPCLAPPRTCERAIWGDLVCPSVTCAREGGGHSGGTGHDENSVAQPGSFPCEGCALRRRDSLGHLLRALWRVGHAERTGSSEKALGVVRRMVTEGQSLE